MAAIGAWLALAVLLSTANQADVRDALARLASSDVKERIAGTRALQSLVESNESLLLDDRVQEALTSLLETENQLIVTNLDDVERNQSAMVDEGFGEHYAISLGLADELRSKVADDGALRRRLLAALVAGSYNPDSGFARGLALEGEPIVAPVLEMSRAGRGPSKWNAYSLSAMLLENSSRGVLKAELSPMSRDALKSSARAGLRDASADVRRHAIRAVVAAKDLEAIPLLRMLAESDPDLGRAPFPYSVRSLAADAVNQLSREADKNQK